MSKLRRDLRLALAGACSGLFSVSVFLLGYRVLVYYEYLRLREAPTFGGYRAVEDLWWIPVVMWNVVLSIVATLLIHRYGSRASTFLRWQAIGAVVLVGWGLTVFTGIGMECLYLGNIRPIERAWSMAKIMPVVQFVATVFAANVLYGSAIQAASMEEVRAQGEANASEA